MSFLVQIISCVEWQFCKRESGVSGLCVGEGGRAGFQAGADNGWTPTAGGASPLGHTPAWLALHNSQH